MEVPDKSSPVQGRPSSPFGGLPAELVLQIMKEYLKEEPIVARFLLPFVARGMLDKVASAPLWGRAPSTQLTATLLEHNHIELYRWARGHGCPASLLAAVAACQLGNLKILKELWKEGVVHQIPDGFRRKEHSRVYHADVPVSPLVQALYSLQYVALESNSPQIVRWLNDCDTTENPNLRNHVALSYVLEGRFDKYLEMAPDLTNHILTISTVFFFAGRGGHLELIDDLLEAKHRSNLYHVARGAASAGKLHVLEAMQSRWNDADAFLSYPGVGIAAASSCQWHVVEWLLEKSRDSPLGVWRTLVKEKPPTRWLRNLLARRSQDSIIFNRLLDSELLSALVANRDADLLEFTLDLAPTYVLPPSIFTEAATTSTVECLELLLTRKEGGDAEASKGRLSGSIKEEARLDEDMFRWLVTHHTIDTPEIGILFANIAPHSDTAFFEWYCTEHNIDLFSVIAIFCGAVKANNLPLVRHIARKKILVGSELNEALKQTPVTAAESGFLEMLKCLILEHGLALDPNHHAFKWRSQSSFFQTLIERGHLDIVRCVFKHCRTYPTHMQQLSIFANRLHSRPFEEYCLAHGVDTSHMSPDESTRLLKSAGSYCTLL